MERRIFLKLSAALIAAGFAPRVAFPALSAPGVPQMRVFQFDECEWVVARTREEAVAFYIEHTGIQSDELEVEEDSLETTMVWGDSPSTDEHVTFAEAIRRHHSAGTKFPEIIAGTDY